MRFFGPVVAKACDTILDAAEAALADPLGTRE